MQNQAIITAVNSTGIATVTLANPQRHNAFDDTIIAELHQAFSELDADPSVRVLVLAAQGKSFSAGADLRWMKRMAGYSYDENLKDAEALANMLRCLNYLSKPTIARVQGAAFGGAVGLVSCCDVAIGTPRASFSLSEVRIGLVPATIGPYVVSAIGQRAARRYFQTAERFDANTALKLGLLSEVVEEDRLDGVIQEIASALLSNGPDAVRAAKQLVFDVSGDAVDDQLVSRTSQLIAGIRVSPQGQEGLAAFLEKRPAHWTRKTNRQANDTAEGE